MYRTKGNLSIGLHQPPIRICEPCKEKKSKNKSE